MPFFKRTRHAATIALSGSLAAAAALALVLAPAALAGKRPSGTTSLTLASQMTSLNPYNPPWCMSEDDYHLRTWTGSLAGSFTATEYLCDPTVDLFNGLWWNSGGIGVQAQVTATGSVTGMSITSPLGVSHPGVLLSSSTSRGVTSYTYEACYMPSVSLTTDTTGRPLPGGTWSATISGTASAVTYSVRSVMSYFEWQQQYCPAAEQNLSP